MSLLFSLQLPTSRMLMLPSACLIVFPLIELKWLCAKVGLGPKCQCHKFRMAILYLHVAAAVTDSVSKNAT